MDYSLALVMPVYNEEGCIGDVITAWHDALSRLNINFLMIVLNDGSTDGTRNKLAQFDGYDRIRVINKENSGHGPTILAGYHLAVEQADWVFQTDSDNELKPDYFHEFWSRRNDYDALFGIRVGRRQGWGRKIISAVSRTTVRILFGRGIIDVNIPYRLIRASILKQIIDQIPRSAFAPNVIISGALASSKVRIFNCPVPHENRKTGSVSIVKWKLWKAAVKSFRQTVTCRPRIGRK